MFNSVLFLRGNATSAAKARGTKTRKVEGISGVFSYVTGEGDVGKLLGLGVGEVGGVVGLGELGIYALGVGAVMNLGSWGMLVGEPPSVMSALSEYPWFSHLPLKS